MTRSGHRAASRTGWIGREDPSDNWSRAKPHRANCLCAKLRQSISPPRSGDEAARFHQIDWWRCGRLATYGACRKQQKKSSDWRALACGQCRGRRSLFHGICRRIARSRIRGWHQYYFRTSKRNSRAVSRYGSGTCIIKRRCLSQRRFSNCVLRKGRYENDPNRFCFRARPMACTRFS